MPTSVRRFLAGDSEMATLIRAYPWVETEIGPPETWPQSLRSMLRMALTTRHPIFIFWGPSGLCFYNDAYRETLGDDRHPRILGMPAQAAWPEIWDIIGPQIAMVMRGEGATWYENQLVPTIRNGVLEDIYWTYSYCPIDEPTSPTGVGGVLVVCNETTSYVRVQREREAELVGMQALFANAPGFMCLLQGPEHIFAFANESYRALVGNRVIEGKTVAEALPEIASQGFIDLLDRVYTSGEPYVGSAERVVLQHMPDAEPEERFLTFLYQPIRNVSGSVIGIFVEGNDVTEQRRADEERLALMDTLSHDLKTPLAALRLQTQMLRRTVMNRGVTDMAMLADRLNGFLDLTNRMTNLIAELDAHTRMAMGHAAPIHRQPTDLIPLVEAGIREIKQSGDTHEIQFDHPHELPVANWDPALLRRLIANLLQNAVKYSPDGGHIHVRLTVDEGEAWLAIEDHGIGIPAADLPHVFDFRRRGSNVVDIGGTGIGLAGAKRIVEQHGGSIEVASVEGEGTIFTVRLPLDQLDTDA